MHALDDLGQDVNAGFALDTHLAIDDKMFWIYRAKSDI